MKRLRRFAIEAVIVVAVIAAFGWWRTREHPRGPLPELTLATLDGRSFALREVGEGRARIVAFFAPWCGVCKATAQNVRWAQRLGGTVVSVASGWDDVQMVRAYVADHEPGGTVLLDEGDRLARHMGVKAYPTFYFVDEDGVVVGSTVGYTTTLGLFLRWWLA